MSMLQNPLNGDDTKKLITAGLLCVLIFVGFELFLSPKQALNAPVAQEEVMVNESATSSAENPGAPTLIAGTANLENAVAEAAKVAANGAQLGITSTMFRGSINTKGGLIDSLQLPEYTVTAEDSALISIFSKEDAHSQFFDAGWLGHDGTHVPSAGDVWSVVGENSALAVGKPVKIMWQNPAGLTFTRTFELEEDSYTIEVTDAVINHLSRPLRLSHYSQIHHKGGIEGDNNTARRFIGPEGMVGEEKTTVDYDDIKESDVNKRGEGGWWGISSAYFLAAILPNETSTNYYRFRYSRSGGQDFTSASVQSEELAVDSGATLERSYKVYAGPKIIRELEKEGQNLDRAVDYGWFDIFARPLFKALMWINDHVGNLGVAIILLTIALKTVLFPLANKSYSSMAKMKKLQPEMEQMKEKYGDNRERFTMEMFALYKKHKVNPASGCWPVLMQIPVFFAMYKMILVSFEFRQEPFMLWITDLSAKDPYFVLPLLMGASMLIQMRLSPATGDPIQQKVMQWMPVVFTALFLMFPSGLVLYWLTNNIYSVIQQYIMLKRAQ